MLSCGDCYCRLESQVLFTGSRTQCLVPRPLLCSNDRKSSVKKIGMWQVHLSTYPTERMTTAKKSFFTLLSPESFKLAILESKLEEAVALRPRIIPASVHSPHLTKKQNLFQPGPKQEELIRSMFILFARPSPLYVYYWGFNPIFFHNDELQRANRFFRV